LLVARIQVELENPEPPLDCDGKAIEGVLEYGPEATG
jgi:hypothetical protein